MYPPLHAVPPPRGRSAAPPTAPIGPSRRVGHMLALLTLLAGCTPLSSGRGSDDDTGPPMTDGLPDDPSSADGAPPTSDMAPTDPDAAPPDAEMTPQRVDGAPPGADGGPLDPDMAPPDPDMAPPDPDMAPPARDMAPPDPDMAPPDPDMALPDPDMALPDPDMALPDPDMAPPEPDMAPPDPDMAPALEICNGLDDDLDGVADEGGICAPCGGIPCPAGEVCERDACVPGPPTPIAAPGEAIAFAGALDDASRTWTRLDQFCRPSVAGRYRYAALRVVNRTGAPQTLDILGEWGPVDGYLLIFADPFDPERDEGCLGGSDDFQGEAQSRVEDLIIEPGAVRVIVVSTFSADAALPDFTVTVRTVAPADACAAVECGPGELCEDGRCVAGPAEPATPIAGPWGSIELRGALDAAAPVWGRPGEGCAAGQQGGFHYAALRVVNRTGAPRTLTVDGDWDGVDGYLHAFADPFDPEDPGGCLAGDDDLGQDAGRSRIAGLAIAPGQVRVLVVSTFAAGVVIPAFTVTVATDGDGEPERCDNAVDDDEDGRVDCDDADCADDPACAPCGGACPSGELCVDDRCVPEPRDTVPLPPPGASVELAYAIDDDDRRIGADRCARPLFGAYCYDVRLVENRAAVHRLVRLDAEWPGEAGYLHVYPWPFDGAGDTQCITGQPEPEPDARASLAALPMAPGEIWAVVALGPGERTVAGAVPVRIETLDTPIGTELRCGGAGDEDGDGQVDCADPDCLLDPGCRWCPGYGGACPPGALCIDEADCANAEGPFLLPPPGDTVDLGHIIDPDQPTWRGPTPDCDGRSDAVEAYRVYRLLNASDVPRSINARSRLGARVAAYRPPFDPATPEACVDDADVNIPRLLVPAGGEVVLVTHGPDPFTDFGLQVETLLDAFDDESRCRDGQDNDLDGLTDCADPDCQDDIFEPCPQSAILGAPGERVSIEGALDEDSPLWQAMAPGCERRWDYFENYEAYRFYNNADVPREVTILANWGEDLGLMSVHDADFDPDVLGGCVSGEWAFREQGPEVHRVRYLTVPARSSLVVTAQPTEERAPVGPFTLEGLTLHPQTAFEMRCDDHLDDDRDGDFDCADDDCGRSVHCWPCAGVQCFGDRWCEDGACVGYPAELDVQMIDEPGGTIALGGRFDARSPVWQRPDAECGETEDAHPFELIVLGNLTGETQRITIEAEFERGRGGLYRWSSASVPDAGRCWEARVGGGLERVVALESRRLRPHGTVNVVVSALDGPYTLRVTTDPERPREICDDGRDDDIDGFTDCADTDCFGPGGPCPDPPAP